MNGSKLEEIETEKAMLKHSASLHIYDGKHLQYFVALSQIKQALRCADILPSTFIMASRQPPL